MGSNRQTTISTLGELSTVGTDVNMEVEEEDEEDVDFIPFLREDTPSEASSSLSSENEATDTRKGLRISSVDCRGSSAVLQPAEEFSNHSKDGENEDEEVVMQTLCPPPEAIPAEPNSSSERGDRRSCPEGTREELAIVDGHDAAYDLSKKELSMLQAVGSSTKHANDSIAELGNEDAICRRTRARHSLADYTLEELEAFLQESDDDDDLRNVDDEEEYRKFLASVLHGGVECVESGQEDGILDEDEDNDADFDLEIEEALESDIDDSLENEKGYDDKGDGDFHRPETRQKRRMKELATGKKNLMGQGKTPLRPILPYMSNAQPVSSSSFGWQFSSPTSFPPCSSSISVPDLNNGFTAHQIGQLYCLLHEHVQLLIQVFSVCVLDPSRQQVTNAVEKMIAEMVDRREEALSWKKVPYPRCCFLPSHLYSSLHVDGIEAANSSWTPVIDIPVASVLDVAPLGLAKKYLNDVSSTLLAYRQCNVEGAADRSCLKKEPLFPLPLYASLREKGGEALAATPSNKASPPLSGELQPKKSLAATLVENTKKQSVALVPRDISKLAQKFYPLFNRALFPHKPPIPAVANRVLFTDAEDRLLAMGLMEYNSDWAAIQQHFLPCKSKHQIFVRQKNRSSSKAPENPIKSVRRMKTSPLTADEQAKIYEGLKIFKHDWVSVWRFFVPHRDPSLLPRQWRIATGTQKSYRKSESHKEKRRLYEANRRKLKASTNDCQASLGNEGANGGDDIADVMDDGDEAYVHEAFLAEMQPENSKCMLSNIPLLSANKSNLQSINVLRYEGAEIGETQASASDDCRVSQQHSGAAKEVCPSLTKFSESKHHLSQYTYVRCNVLHTMSSRQLPSKFSQRSSRCDAGSKSCQSRKSKGVRLVKLAPDLPPVNLPPSGRVLSQSAFKSYNSGSSIADAGPNGTTKFIARIPRAVTERDTVSSAGKHKIIFSRNGHEACCQQDGSTLPDWYLAEDNASGSELQMHPLLFEAPEDRFSSYYLMNCSSSSMYNFFPGNSAQDDANNIKHHHSAMRMGSVRAMQHPKEASLSLHTIDFHPLLQRTENGSSESTILSSSDHQSIEGNRDPIFEASDRMRNRLTDELVRGAQSPIHQERENELDLDIRLYPAIDKRKMKESKGASGHQRAESSTPTLNMLADENMPISSLCHDQRDKFPDFFIANSSPVQSRACASKNGGSVDLVSPRNGGAYKCTDGLHDESTDIVMEQEELSDTDEESEHVEFECEEMADSDGEELAGEQPTEIQNEDMILYRTEIFNSAAEERIVDAQNLEQSPSQLKSVTQGLVGSGKYHETPKQLVPYSSQSSQTMPNHDSRNADRSCIGSPNVHSGLSRPSKKRCAENSKLRLPGTELADSQTITERSSTPASRKPRKGSK